jgi:hypothetical protein
MPSPAAAGIDIARIRDIPRLCICEWVLNRTLMRWVRTGPRGDCPWHGGRDL